MKQPVEYCFNFQTDMKTNTSSHILLIFSYLFSEFMNIFLHLKLAFYRAYLN